MTVKVILCENVAHLGQMGATVKAGHSYPLYGKAEKEWLEWSPRIQP